MNPVMEALVSARANEMVSELITPPRSWGKAEKIAFLNLPPELQRFYAKREEQRDSEVRRCQNDVAKARKALAEAQREFEQGRKPEERNEDQQDND